MEMKHLTFVASCALDVMACQGDDFTNTRNASVDPTALRASLAMYHDLAVSQRCSTTWVISPDQLA